MRSYGFDSQSDFGGKSGVSWARLLRVFVADFVGAATASPIAEGGY